MSRITLIIGLPGSGKTYLASKMTGYIIDDIKSITQLINTSQDIVISDVNFCDDKILQKSISMLGKRYPTHTISCIYFENNPEKCRQNVIYRNDGRNVEGTIARFTPIYNPPVGAKAIWSPE